MDRKLGIVVEGLDEVEVESRLLRAAVALVLACNGVHPAGQRCARSLLQTHDRVGADQFLLTQEFLAQMLGVRRARANSAAGLLREAGLIGYARGRMTILDRRGLESASCECYRVIGREFDRLLG